MKFPLKGFFSSQLFKKDLHTICQLKSRQCSWIKAEVPVVAVAVAVVGIPEDRPKADIVLEAEVEGAPPNTSKALRRREAAPVA